MKPKDDEKLRSIAEATFALVEQTGLSGLTMASIAKAAGVATSTLYVYYPSKDALISQLYETAKTATAARFMEGVVDTAPIRARVRCIWGNMVSNRLEHYAEVLFQEQFYNSQWFTEENRELVSRLFARFFALIEDGQQQEVLKPVPAMLLLGSLAGSVRETVNLIRSKTLPGDEAMLGMAFSLCWDGIKA
jgi:TetR/AcrR family transcriptional repressor of multidrug resistance operon